MADVMEEMASTTPNGVADVLDPPLGNGPSDIEIYRKLRDAIETGRFEPGDRLPPERDLALRFGSSRNLVRRAVQRLERERRVIRHVGRGTFVASAEGGGADGSAAALSSNVSPLDVLEARMAIEPGFADMVVARASEDDFSRLENRLRAMEDAPTQQEFREAGYAFHLELARTTRNPLLVRIFELIIEARAAAGWGRLRALNDTIEARAAQTAANRDILLALRDRDSELARRLIRAHLGRMVASVAFSRSDE
jgi:DNA-binding FadR family transcriptional regulator